MPSETRNTDARNWDPYLVSAVNQCKEAASEQVSENIAVAMDELGTTSSRRSAILLQLQGKNLS